MLGRQGSIQLGGNMKRLLLMSASLLALMAAAPIASATTFLAIGDPVDFRVPATGTYEILAYGAAGGGLEPGKGAKINGDFSLEAGQVLQIAVGGEGKTATYGASGGGGGSFVIGPYSKPLVIAGGGGGSAPKTDSDMAGYGGQTAKDGGDGQGSLIEKGKGGSSGGGGSGGGGGFAGPGYYGNGPNAGGRGGLLGLNGGVSTGGGDGGFGGGGGSDVFYRRTQKYFGGGGGGRLQRRGRRPGSPTNRLRIQWRRRRRWRLVRWRDESGSGWRFPCREWRGRHYRDCGSRSAHGPRALHLGDDGGGFAALGLAGLRRRRKA